MDKTEKADISMSKVALKSEDNQMKQIPSPSYNRDEKWVQEYIKQFGEEPSFF